MPDMLLQNPADPQRAWKTLIRLVVAKRDCLALKQFADGDVPRLYAEDTIYTQDEIIRRAESRLGEKDYNLIINNCQNFATWCRLGD